MPPGFPWGGLVGGVLPDPPVVGYLLPPPSDFELALSPLRDPYYQANQNLYFLAINWFYQKCGPLFGHPPHVSLDWVLSALN